MKFTILLLACLATTAQAQDLKTIIQDRRLDAERTRQAKTYDDQMQQSLEWRRQQDELAQEEFKRTAPDREAALKAFFALSFDNQKQVLMAINKGVEVNRVEAAKVFKAQMAKDKTQRLKNGAKK